MPLAGVRILDLSRLLPGPYATRQLAELGAEVIKVEDPQGGDYARWYPPLVGDPPVSGIFAELNRGKKSVALDLKDADAVAAVRILASRSDVLVDSFRPGVLARLGLDPRALMAENPRLIYCAITGFGLFGPDAHRAGHDIGYLARSGALGLSGPAERVVPPGVQVADVGGAMSAVAGILAALFERERTGRGKVVDISLAEAAMPFGVAEWGMQRGGRSPRRGHEMLDGSRPCYGVYRTKDGGFVAVGSLEPKFWAKLLQTIGLPDLEPAALDGGESGERAKSRIEARFLERTRDEWAAVFREVEACVEPVLEIEEVRRDPHLLARGVFDAEGMVRGPVRLHAWDREGDRGPDLSPAPALGEHTREILTGLDLPPDILGKLAPGP